MQITEKAYIELKELSKDDENIFFIEEGDIFSRIINKGDIDKNETILPTEEWDNFFAESYDLLSNLKGYYVGDPDEWAIVMIKDGYLDDPENIVIADLVFPIGTIAFRRDRPKGLGEYGSDELITESFVIYEYPIKPKSIRLFTKEEKTILNTELKKWM